MEAAGLRRRRNIKAPVGTFLLLMFLFLPASCLPEEAEKQPACPHGDYRTDEGVCCNKCSPGFKLVEVCHAVGQRSNCTACPADQFSDQMNFMPNCRRCRRCKLKNEEVDTPCERYQNTICRCKKGFYKYRIDSETYECRRCSSCRSDEQQIQQCSQDQNTVCGCKEGYYKGARGVCEACKNCSDECKLHCTSPPMLNTKGQDRTTNLVPVVAGVAAVAVVMLVLGIFITYMTTKRFTKRKLLKSSSQLAEASPDSCQESLVYSEEPSENNVNAQRYMTEQETSNLPDCVPLEIRIPELIYSVLDLVPVLQVKQLVRCLGVKDSEIEQADLDHRSCREAHYQMLRVWAERGSRAAGGGGTLLLPLPLLQELIDKLRLMHLGRAAEELEIKYCIQ
ncbi:tumor necrosis factor receptor superfamily member 1A [Acanthochromis polyacanthus]|uniref:Tumor necrosis factor receptor superfamily, member 1a n=1 Tax=Acanthochromis polyacanthus TaxID=80966 RepID=A0A3Q1ESW9_9TELE|nr:tumor necrosis factor receptor superfamily member 1A [Acanthochromis polyacanthus]